MLCYRMKNLVLATSLLAVSVLQATDNAGAQDDTNLTVRDNISVEVTNLTRSTFEVVYVPRAGSAKSAVHIAAGNTVPLHTFQGQNYQVLDGHKVLMDITIQHAGQHILVGG
ncbi:hypothetical protein GCM10009077_20000 [Roseibium denhamense]|uniref:Uncharacterized protein n=2 Tax=Roseibium denhamense TaxID=76305 RepID=A0ABY1P6X4_9HYPH|nr:hypothetical protein SAMN06265374_2577 [Roseibium denhamense]